MGMVWKIIGYQRLTGCFSHANIVVRMIVRMIVRIDVRSRRSNAERKQNSRI